MCGLVGIVGRTVGGLFTKDMDLFEQMLIIDTLRGKDSTGVFAAFKNKSARVVKLASHPFHLFRAAEYHKFKSDVAASGRFVIGHNRAATRGTIKNDNAHPFVENHIILVHNGTLWDDGGSVSKATVEVDSHAIAHALAEKSPKEVLPNINGAFALIWYDTKQEKLFAVRNKERPLYVIVTKDHFILSSEHWIGAMPAKRQDREILDVIDVEPGDLYSWDLKGVMEKETIDLNSVTAPLYKKHTYFPYSVLAEEVVEDDDIPFVMGGSGTPTKEITNLREALKNETKPSNVCALTRTTDTGAGRTPHIIQTPSEEDRAWSNMSALRVDLHDYPKNSRLLVKILSTHQAAVNGRIRYTGKIHEPGKELLDCVGYLPKDTSPSSLQQWIDNPCYAHVMFATRTNNGGISLFMKETMQATMSPIHQGEVPLILWQNVLTHTMCGECKRKVEPWEKYFTSVKIKSLMIASQYGNPLNVACVTCPDCIAEKIQDADYREVFKARYRNAKEANANRNSSVQDREQLSPGTGVFNGKVIELPSSPTLQ